MIDKVLQRNVYLCELEPTLGSEQGGHRPVLIVQNDVGNKYSKTTIIVSITSKNKKNLPTHYKIEQNKYSFLDSNNNIVLCETVRQIDKSRLEKYIGQIDEKDYNEIYQKIINNLKKNEIYS